MRYFAHIPWGSYNQRDGFQRLAHHKQVTRPYSFALQTWGNTVALKEKYCEYIIHFPPVLEETEKGKG